MKMPKAWTQTKVMAADEAAKPQAELPKWWLSLSDEARDEYVAEHPHSKYAEIHKGAPANEPGLVEKKHEPEAEPKEGDQATEPGKTNEIHQLVNSPEMLPASPARKKLAAVLTRKTKDIMGHLKHEAKEWKVAGTAFALLARGKALDEHQKKAVAAVAADLANVTISVLLGGALVHGAQAVAQHMIGHIAQEAVVKAAIKGSVHHANVRVLSMGPDKDETEKVMEEALKILIKELESGDLKKYLAKAVEQGERKVKSNVEAGLDMGADVAGRGICPECKTPMQIVMSGDSKVWACVADRITLPVPDDML